MGVSFKRMLSILLTLTLAFSIVSCSKDGGKSSMGRYVEERYEVPEGVEVQSLSLLENNKVNYKIIKSGAYVGEKVGLIRVKGTKNIQIKNVRCD